MERRESHRGQSSVCFSPHTSYRWRGERESLSQSSVCSHHTPATGGEERRVIEPIKCMRSPHNQLQVERRRSHRDNQVYALTTHQLQVERRESHRANQVYALTTHQLQVERRESHRDNQVYALTTHQLQVERRESHRANQVDWYSTVSKATWSYGPVKYLCLITAKLFNWRQHKKKHICTALETKIYFWINFCIIWIYKIWYELNIII